MSIVKRRRDAIDALEHAMQGVQTTEPKSIERHDYDPGIIGKRSDVRIDIFDDDDTPVEHEITVVMGRRPRRERVR